MFKLGAAMEEQDHIVSMEEKESTASGSPLNSDTDSPSVSGVVPQVMHVPVNVSMEKVLTAGGGGGGGGGGGSGGGVVLDLLGPKKRGRPRKYDADGNLRLPASPPSGFTLTHSSDGSKRGRGRPAGSGNWQLLASLGELFANTAGGDFMPHVVNVNTGEDVASRILSFSHKGPRGICILSANGSVSNVTIRQPGSSGGILTYEGRFEILALSGSFTVTEKGGIRSRTGGLSVSLAGPDGRVIGGGIAGLLTAASPIQMVVGSFSPKGFKEHKRKKVLEHGIHSVNPGATTTATVTAATPISQATPYGIGSPMTVSPTPIQSHVKEENSASEKPMNSASWSGLMPMQNQRPSPDINLSLTSE